MTEGHRPPRRHGDTGPEGRKQSVSEKDAEAGARERGAELEPREADRGVQTTDSDSVPWSQRGAWAQRRPSSWQNRRGTEWWLDGGRGPRGFVRPYHAGGLATLVLQLQEGVQVLRALQQGGLLGASAS